MEILYFLQSIRTPFWDSFFSLVTTLGEETVFVVVAMAFFWCMDKQRGYYLLLSGFLGSVATQFLKITFRIPRPWVVDPNYTIVESAREMATGFSFPSGHTQCAATLFGGIARTAKKRLVQILAILAILLVAFARMYLGVHTPLDIAGGLLLGAILVFGIYPLYRYACRYPKWMYAIIATVFVATLGNLIYLLVFPFPTDMDPEIFSKSLKSAWQMSGLILGVCLIYPIDRRWIRFETRAVWWIQLIKLAGGVGLILGVRFLLKAPLNALFGVSFGCLVRYFLMAVVGGILWPISFRFLARLDRKKQPTNQ